MDNDTLILILFLVINVLTGCCLGLLDSRNFWRKKWQDDEDFIIKNLRGYHDN